MSTLSLYEKTSPFEGKYVIFLVNRLQMLYFVLIMPTYLVHPYMLWVIIMMGILSQVNLIILSKWFSSHYSANGYQGFVQLFGERMSRLLIFITLILLFIKINVLTFGYVEAIHHFIFPSMNHGWIAFFIILLSCYLAAKGIENSIRFVVIVFLSTFWMIFLFIPFFFPPIAHISDLYPLIPVEWSMDSWKGLLLIWSSLSGPEYLVCLAPWIKPQQKVLKYLTFANTVTVFEYLILFTASLLFFGSNYLGITKFPVINMVRYLESPLFERLDILLLSFQSFLYVFLISLFILCCYGYTRIILGRWRNKTTSIGFLTSCLLIIAGMIIFNEMYWKSETGQQIWLNLQIWLGAMTYTIVPVLLLCAMKLKERARL